MPYRDATADRKEARKYYVELGITNITRLAALTSIPARTLTRWRDDEKWDELKDVQQTSPQAIGKIYFEQLRKLLQSIAEKKDKSQQYTPAEMKQLAFLRREALLIFKDIDMNGVILTLINDIMDIVIELPKSKFKDKKQFIEDLQSILPIILSRYEEEKAPI
jgi:hypothetical protein